LSKIVVVYVGHVSQLHPFITVKDDNERLVTLSPTYHWWCVCKQYLYKHVNCTRIAA